MSYIEKEKLIKADIDSIENRVRHAFNQGYDLGYKEGKERAKSQEPILDKIRAEIEQDAFKDVNNSKFISVNRINQILDKYRAESEVDNGNNDN